MAITTSAKTRRRNESRLHFWQTRNGRRRIQQGIALILILAGVPAMLIPFIWMISASLKDLVIIGQVPIVWIPRDPQWRNYINLFRLPGHDFARYFLNSAFIATMTAFGATLSCALVGFGFARTRFPGRDWLFVAVLSTVILPYHVTLVPHYMMVRYLGWLDTYYPLIVPHFLAVSGFYVFLMRQFFLTIPFELDDAARMDGAGLPGIFWYIMLPLSKPALAIVALFSFQSAWNDFLGPLIYLNSKDKLTVPLALKQFVWEFSTRVNLMMAASVLAILPILVLFFLFQRYFIQGIVVTGVEK
jgi:ABC-type glycerol-3-phosphate transport system permease component